MSEHPLVYIRWKDHTADGKWIDVEEFHKPSLIHSIGRIYKEDDEGITLASCWQDDDKANVSNAQYVLKSCIVERKVVAAPWD